MVKHRAFVTGITGQDGAYLAKLLLDGQGYIVHGLMRRLSNPDLQNLDYLGITSHPNLEIVEGDLHDGSSVGRIIQSVRPEEVYNLAAQSHVRVSFDEPIHTTQVNHIGVLHLLEAVRSLPPGHCRFYQAGTSEMFGGAEAPQHEGTRFQPRSPYAVAKLAAYWSVRNYREGYGLHASTGILFNHESPIRGPAFVTRKITKYVARLALVDRSGSAFSPGPQVIVDGPLELGNLEARRDWGFAGDYVRGMYMMLQQDKPDDYVLGTGKCHTVRDFVGAAFEAGFPEARLEWSGAGTEEVGQLVTNDGKQGRPVVVINPKFYRPLEVNLLQANAGKAEDVLGWTPQTGFSELVAMMVQADILRIQGRNMR